MMTHIDLVGYLAASLVLLTFQMKSMGALRLTSVAGSTAFITYAVLADLAPVLVLHSILMLTNLYRLREMSKHEGGQPRTADRPIRIVLATVVFVALILTGRPTNANELKSLSQEEPRGDIVVMGAVACTADLLVCSSLTPPQVLFLEMVDCVEATAELKRAHLVRTTSLKPVIFARCRFDLIRTKKTL